MTTIKLKNGSGAPTAGDLVQGEPALDLTNKRLYTEDSLGTVIEVGTNPGTDVTFADNRKAIFGAGSDLQIYHDGSHSIIQDAGTGDLILQGGNDLILRETDGSTEYLRANEGAGVQIFHNGSQKFLTTSTGIDVTGTVTADGLTVSSSSGSTSPIVNISNGVDVTPNRQLAISETGGSGFIYKIDSTGASGLFGQLNLATNGTNRINIGSGGDISFYDTDGSTASFVYDASAGLTINEAGADRDFRVESDTNANMLFVDAGNNAVKIGTSGTAWNSVTPLQIGSGAVSSYTLSNNILIASNWYYQSADKYVTADEAAMYKQEGGNHYFYTAPFGTANAAMTLTERFRVELDGTSVFNEPGVNADFRVESDSNAYGFFLDASTTSVGVNHTASPGGYAQFVVRFSGSDSNVNTTGVAIQDSGTNSNISFCTFFNSAGGGIGSITRVGTTNAVAYNTTSDRRAKENIADADDAGAVIDAIKVRKFDWIEGNQHQPYGMIAQELVEHAPEVVHQPADEEDMMGVDYSKLVPMLIKEIQSLRARVAQLESN